MMMQCTREGVQEEHASWRQRKRSKVCSTSARLWWLLWCPGQKGSMYGWFMLRVYLSIYLTSIFVHMYMKFLSLVLCSSNVHKSHIRSWIIIVQRHCNYRHFAFEPLGGLRGQRKGRGRSPQNLSNLCISYGVIRFQG
jgi:hypothetical protein